jgi:hypothetical protein
LVTASRTDEGGTIAGFQFVVGVGDLAEHLSLVVLPYSGLIGNPFNVAQIAGSAGK